MNKLFVCLFALLPVFAGAQKLATIEEKTKGMKHMPGFLPVYYDEDAGKLYLEVSKWNEEVLYLTTLPAGLGSNDIGLDRGRLGEDRVVKFVRNGRKVMLVQPNYGYRAVSKDMAEQRAVEQSFAQSILWGFSAEAITDNKVLVDATDFLLRDAIKAAQAIRRLNQGVFVVDKTRSAIYLPATKNFPLNTELEAVITLTNSDGNTGNYLRSVAPSDEAVTLRMHHAFVQLPDAGYTPRVFDPRSSFIPMSYFDYATPVNEPIEKKFILRHRLQKKDPNAERSEAIKPIVYYLDNGTPEPIRTALLEGARWWNQAFEAAGFINGFQVQVLPDSADPMDIRYNMINWVHRSTRGWSYGSSVVDPRTGEIIKGNVTLGSLRVRQDYLIFSALLAPFENDIPANDPMLKASLDRLRQLSAHEVGHTLGLMHNYASSVSNRASVMDYPHPLVTLDAKGNIDMSKVYDMGIGEWDKVSINWGYRQFADASDEATKLSAVLDAAAAKGLQFISDKDARAPGGMHPQAHLWDNGESAVAELKNVMKVRAKAMQQFGEKNVRPGMPLALLEDAFVPLYFYHRYQLEAATKLVGGMNYTYALRGKGTQQTSPVSKAQQVEALNAIIACMDPAALMIPERIASLIPPRPAGYEETRELFKKRTGMSFDRLTPAETAVDVPLSFLFHPERLNRLDQQKTTVGFGADDLFATLIDSTWKQAERKGMEKQIQQQTRQVLLTYLLSASINSENSFGVRAAANTALSNLKTWLESMQKTAPAAEKGFYALALERMKAPQDAKPTQHAPIPPGAPIGCDW